MANRSSSNKWRQRQDSDPFVKRAQAEGWRSRAVFKLMEIQDRDKLIRPGHHVLDLGSSPGAWSQYATKLVGPSGRVVAVDLLEMQTLSGVDFVRGDFREAATLNEVLNRVADRRLDLVMSDMAPNISGTRSVDQPRAMYLAELALDMAKKSLRPGGSFIVKLFHGEGFDEFVRAVRPAFETVRVRKPEASRKGSRETYLMARDYQL
jgi:23S rRNA (uridine2552-2'-O)-methyltransferase